MKKLFLSSVIMLGVCGIASAQTGSKSATKKAVTTTVATPTAVIAPATPQQASVEAVNDLGTTPVAATAAPQATEVKKVEVKADANKTVVAPAAKGNSN